MAARFSLMENGSPVPARIKKIRHDDNTRAKIKAGNIIARLVKLIAGEIEMPPHAVTAALGLLRKTLPDLTSVEVSKDVTVTYVARMPRKQTSMEQWQNNYVPEHKETLQ